MDPSPDYRTWEGVARAVHDATCVSAPVDAFELARACNLDLVPRLNGSASLMGSQLFYNATTRLTRQHGQIAHEVAHWALRWCGELDDEQAARFTSGALMLPRADFSRDLRETSWDLNELRARHPNASAEMIARRIVELRDACVAILDHGKLRARIVSPTLPAAYLRLTTFESELGAACLESGRVERWANLCSAVPMFDGNYRRVIVVCEAQQLSQHSAGC